MRQAIRTTLRSGLLAAALGGFALYAPVSQAAGTAAEQYKQEVHRCNTTPGIDKKACLRGAGAALEESRKGNLTTPSPQQEEQNLTSRCGTLPADQQADCQALMTGSDVREQGSVDAGGVLRETTITIPADTGTTTGTGTGAATGAVGTGSSGGSGISY